MVLNSIPTIISSFIALVLSDKFFNTSSEKLSHQNDQMVHPLYIINGG